ncbi:hypothetical protein [Pallidibacillus pasinlerensis]|uniref:Uncharacterized protein n=1 Tax=Pallidibacillus pasinlerensis TaxID=2703818 RepID=A0ABX0A3M9_9BACI|nr:hypothetical protein [Pallidibacillus pasinlerensis]NCU18046.1 hypothetical protein [Pallidibacillus pasinlerensis]
MIPTITEYLLNLFRPVKEPTEEEINENITLLLDFPWFKEIYEVEQFRKLIEDNETIRNHIGRTNVKRLKLYPRKQLQLKSQIEEIILSEIRG